MDLTGADWRKSRYSGNNGGNYVEVATNLPGTWLSATAPTRTASSWSSRRTNGTPASVPPRTETRSH